MLFAMTVAAETVPDTDKLEIIPVPANIVAVDTCVKPEILFAMTVAAETVPLTEIFVGANVSANNVATDAVLLIDILPP